MNITQYIPARARRPIYGAFAVIGVVIGALQVGYAAVDVANPQWLLVTLAVFPFVAGAVGFTAQAATDATAMTVDPDSVPDDIEPEPDELSGDNMDPDDEELTEDELDALLEEDDTPPPPGYVPAH